MSLKTVNIRCLNTGRTHKVPVGYSLEEIAEMLEVQLPYGITNARVNNKNEDLHYMVFGDKQVEFIGIDSPAGHRTYSRTLFFVLYKALRNLYGPGCNVRIDTPISNGYYCQFSGLDGGVTPEVIARLRQEMERIVSADYPVERHDIPTAEAIRMFRSEGLEDKAKLLETSHSLYTHYYTLDQTPNYFYGALLIRTGQLNLFALEPYGDGLLLRVPDWQNPTSLRPLVEQPKMFGVFQEQHRWQQILGLSTIGELNAACEAGHTNILINVSEALQEKKISRMADRIVSNDKIRVILVAGPSSSGKTTFSKRLAVQVMAAGKVPVAISLDDYFVDRTATPRDETGDYDFESLYALNIPLLNAHLCALLNGEEVELPRYNFQTGRSEMSGERLRLQPNQLLILEGIHALNPELTSQIPAESKYRIYASALTAILLDNHNYIPTADNRLLRRIVRDYKYRGYSALDTIRRWPSVRKGENKWIFPYQEEADEMMNTALLFELAALREQALPILEQVPETEPEYAEAYRLRKFLGYLNPISQQGLPPTSLLREFLGGSTFHY